MPCTFRCRYFTEIKKRRSANDLDSLMKAIAESSESVVSENLESSPVVQSARDFLSRQLRVKQYNMVMQTLTSQTVTDVADCQRPNNICFVVLRSTYLLLGEDRPLQVSRLKQYSVLCFVPYGLDKAITGACHRLLPNFLFFSSVDVV